MIKIALTGKMRSGKDTLKEYAINKYGVVPFAFGDELKEAFHEDYAHIPHKPKPRKGYQLYGQLMRFVHGEDIWVDKCFRHIRVIKQTAIDYNTAGGEVKFTPMITDVRQQNELDRCKQEDYIIIRVNCLPDVQLERLNETGDNFTIEDLAFETETSIDDLKVDYDIHNNGTLEELYSQLDEIVEKERKRLL